MDNQKILITHPIETSSSILFDGNQTFPMCILEEERCRLAVETSETEDICYGGGYFWS